MKTRKKASVIAICGLMAATTIGASLAYWNKVSEIDNPFDTGKYGSTIVEDFKPKDGEDWQPGAEVNKDVVAVNTGDTDLIVRARLDETWTYKGESTPYKDSKNSEAGYDVYTVEQAVPDDGLTAKDKSVVIKNFSSSENWIKGTDGWWYYKMNLSGGQTSDKWLDSVELINEADIGKIETSYWVTASDDADSSNWIWYKYTGKMPAYIDAEGNACNENVTGARFVLHNKVEIKYDKDSNGKDLKGYSDSDYSLKVTIQTVQATSEAVDAVFGKGSTFTAPSGCSWTLK